LNKASLEKILAPLNTFWEGMSKSKKIRFVTLVLVFVIIAAVCVAVLGRKEYAVLYSNMELQEAGEVLSKLKEMKIDAKVSGHGTVLVQKNMQDTVRMQLAAEGYPKSGLNYDVFQNSTGFGTTEFEKQKYLQFQLQERLQNSIKSLEIVEDAIVTINIPDNSSFVLQQDKQKSSASIILKLKDNEKLSKEQIKGIAGLIAKSVPGLTDEQVLMVDSFGNSIKGDKLKDDEIAGERLELENSMSDRIKRQVLELLEPVFGAGRVTTGVRVTLDFDKQTTESIKYDPVGESGEGIAASSNIMSEEATNMGQSGAIGQDPNGALPQYMQEDAGGGQYKKTNKTINYEINQIRDSIQKAQGQIKDISISVLLDENGVSQDAEAKVKDIVAGAVGVAADKVTVRSIAFDGAVGINKIFDDARQTDYLVRRHRLLRNSVMFLLLAIALALAYLFLPKLLRKKQMNIAGEGIYEVVDGVQSKDEIDFKIQKSSKRELIEKSIEKNPEFIAQLLRSWLKDEVR